MMVLIIFDRISSKIYTLTSIFFYKYIKQMKETKQRQYANEYTIHFLLGQGGQANVYLGSKGPELYALKVYLPGSSKEEAYKLEVQLLSQFEHKHLINMISHNPKTKIKLQNQPQQTRPMIVLQLAQQGELFEYISKTGKFNPQVVRTYAKQLASALKYLYQKGYSHRDLKPENILFDKHYNLKISDFGLAKEAKGKKGDFILTSKVGTVGYKAPEIQLGLQYQGLKADMFAFGVIIFVMYSGNPPFLGTRSYDRVYKLITEKNYSKFWQLHQKNKNVDFYSDEFRRMINSFISADPNQRPTFQSLEDDEWWNGDELMQNQLVQYMQQKSKALDQKNQLRSKIAQVRKKLYSQKIKQQQSKQLYRADRLTEEEENEQLSKEEVFVNNFYSLDINVQTLPTYHKIEVHYATEKPQFIVCWIKEYFKTQFQVKNIFLQQFVQNIKPIRYEVDYIAKDFKMDIHLIFQIDDEDETQVILEGQLHKNQEGKIGVDWIKKQGNIYWLSEIKNGIILELQSL